MRGMRMVMVTTVLSTLAAPAMFAAPVAAQGAGEAEAVMRAAAQYALERLPSGQLKIDAHRTGAPEDRTIAQRLASALGGTTGTLEAERQCVDRLDASTCRLEGTDLLLAISAPSINDDEAEVRVYAWYKQDSARQPVAEMTLRLRLARQGAGWRVVGQG